MELSLMTLNLFFMIFYRYMILGDLEELRENYEEMLDVIQAAGYTYVDILAMETQILETAYVKEQLQKRGLRVNCLMYGDQFASRDREADQAMIDGGRGGVDTSLELGCNLIMLIPQVREDMSGVSRDDVHNALKRRWAPIALYAREKGVIPVIEDTPSLQLHLCGSEDLQEIFSCVPQLDMVYDSGNMLLVKEDPVAYYKKFENKISHIHLKDMKIAQSLERRPDKAIDGTYWETAPSGTGVINFPSLLRVIKDSGYQGRLTVEFCLRQGDNTVEALKESKKYFEEMLECRSESIRLD